jgi:hypothetical protein
LKIPYRKYSTILGRTPEIIFQQIMLNVIVRSVAMLSPSPLILSGILFSLGHSPTFLIKRLPKSFSLIILILAFVGGFSMSYLILNVQNGWLWSFALHFSFYYIVALFTGEKDQLIP